MPQAQVNKLKIEYEILGDETAPAILLIMGLARQLIGWPDQLCQILVNAGYRVIRFDNRDCGLSTWMTDKRVPDISQLTLAKQFGWRLPVPYSLEDMAADAVGLLDALDIDKAHVAGVSLGGMIAQLVAIDNPHRVLSLTSLMSTTGNPFLPGPTAAVTKSLVLPHPCASDEEAIVARAMAVYRSLAGGNFPIDDSTLRESYLRAARRAYYPAGSSRQLAASIVARDRRVALRRLAIPTTVYHGSADPLIPLACGEDTAKNIADAELIIEPGLGHEMPPQLVPNFSAAILSSAKRA